MPQNYRVGVVGLSGIAANRRAAEPGNILKTPSPSSHMGAYHLIPQTDVVAVCELKTELFEKVADTWGQEFGELETYTDYRAMIERENLDIVSVVTSDHRHTDIVVEACKRRRKGNHLRKAVRYNCGRMHPHDRSLRGERNSSCRGPHQSLGTPL